MQNGSQPTGKDLFESSLAEIQRILGFLAARNQLDPTEREDLVSYVTFKLIEDDYRRLRQFRGESRLETYLNVVVQRLFLDFRTERWGKWRPSARARALGRPAILLERMIYRDGLPRNEARRALEDHGIGLGADGFELLLQEIPHRPRPRRVAVDELDALPDTKKGRLSEAERALAARRLEAALAAAARELSAEDRLVLKLRFVDGFTVKEIAETLGLGQRPLYTRVKQLLRRLRVHLERSGLRRNDVRAVWVDRVEVDIEAVLVRPALRASVSA